MRLTLTVEKLKDKSGKVKTVLIAHLTTELKGMEQIDAVAEIEKKSVLGKELAQLTIDMIATKKKAIQEAKFKK